MGLSLFYFVDERSPALLFRRILDLELTIVSSHGSKVMYKVKSFPAGHETRAAFMQRHAYAAVV